MAQLDLGLEEIYVIDTNSLVDIRDEQDPTKIWEGIFRMIRRGRLKTVDYVYPELKRMADSGKLPLEAYNELKELKGVFVIPDEELFAEAGRINLIYPKLGDMWDARNRADPWIVAAGKVKGWKIITEERDTGPGKTHRIPWVCDQEGVAWMRLSRFIQKEKFLD